VICFGIFETAWVAEVGLDVPKNFAEKTTCSSFPFVDFEIVRWNTYVD
jgi:hypothetical protein